jgi:isoquinoline 1-oxidoreductase beta subunit
MDEAPEVEIYIVASDRPPGGFSKSAVPPIAPTVANAIFAATGKRVRQYQSSPRNSRVVMTRFGFAPGRLEN